VALTARLAAGRRFSTRLHPRHDRKESPQPGCRVSRLCSNFTCGRTAGRTTIAGRRRVNDLKQEGLIRAIGVSVNRWEPWNVVETLRTDLIDTVQMIYNIFDQAPEDELFPLCESGTSA